MSRRVSLPGADELFRQTRTAPDAPPPTAPAPDPSPARPQQVGKPAAADAGDAPLDRPARVHGVDEDGQARAGKAGPSGRVRHDEKITVYVSTDELLDLEQTRLALRRDHGLGVDRGRIVREAIHLALEDAARNGPDSALVRRLTES